MEDVKTRLAAIAGGRTVAPEQIKGRCDDAAWALEWLSGAVAELAAEFGVYHSAAARMKIWALQTRLNRDLSAAVDEFARRGVEGHKAVGAIGLTLQQALAAAKIAIEDRQKTAT
jgi:hypothetical protein